MSKEFQRVILSHYQNLVQMYGLSMVTTSLSIAIEERCREIGKNHHELIYKFDSLDSSQKTAVAKRFCIDLKFNVTESLKTLDGLNLIFKF